MKKKLIAIISLILSLIFMVSAVGCGETPEDENSNNGNNKPTNVTVNRYYNGTHVFTAEDTDKKLVENGKTSYVIVMPENPTTYEITAKNEFIALFKKATDIRLKTVNDTGLTYDENAKYISIGDTTLLETSGLTIDKKALSHSGCRIITKGNTVFISGGEREGVIYSVYDFMEIMFNFDVFYKDCLTIDTGLTEVPLKNFDVTDIPDFINRPAAYSVTSDQSSDEDAKMFETRMRLNFKRNHHYGIYKEFNNPKSGASNSHCTTSHILTREMYAEEHPGWFSDNGDQWCYTAHGNPEEYELMVLEIVKKCLNTLQYALPENTDPYYDTFFLAQSDNGDSCSCDGCVDAAAKYGAESGAMVVLINDVSRLFKKMYTELKEAEPDNPIYGRDVDSFYFQMFAYLFSVQPPTKYNEATGKWEATHPDVVCEDNIIVETALTNTWTWHSIMSEDNKEGRETIQGWAAICKHIEYWVYNGNFQGHAYPTVDFNFVNGETYSWLQSYCNNSLYTETMGSSGSQTAWHNLTMYVNYKLQWNSSLDVKELQDKWFKAMYKDQATVEIMQGLFDEVDQYRRHIYLVDGGEKNFMGKHVEYAKYFPYQTVYTWYEKCNQAIESIEKYKGTDLYEQIYFHIESEAISPMFLMLNLYGSRMSTSLKNEIKARLLADVERFDIAEMRVDDSKLVDWIKTIV